MFLYNVILQDYVIHITHTQDIVSQPLDYVEWCDLVVTVIVRDTRRCGDQQLGPVSPSLHRHLSGETSPTDSSQVAAVP